MPGAFETDKIQKKTAKKQLKNRKKGLDRGMHI